MYIEIACRKLIIPLDLVTILKNSVFEQWYSRKINDLCEGTRDFDRHKTGSWVNVKPITLCCSAGRRGGARRALGRRATNPQGAGTFVWPGGMLPPDAVDDTLFRLLPSGVTTITAKEAAMLAALFGDHGEMPARPLSGSKFSTKFCSLTKR
jgi:hypothetical protein